MSLPELTLLPDGLPAIPRRHRSVGPEPLALALEPLRRQELPQAVGQRVAFANAIVPDGHTSSRRSWKIRNISAVHRPMPRTTETRVMTSSSASLPRRG